MTQFLTRLRILAVAAAALAVLALPAGASAKSRDRNHDGIADNWAKRNHVRGANKDPDKDGLTNRAEFLSGTNPHKADTDRDGVPDANEDPDHDGVDNGNEIRERTSPRLKDTNHNGRNDGQEDADHDRLNNTGEDQASDDPINPDSDGDGVRDGDEGAGKVVSFDGTQLVLRLFSGASLAGTVDENTEVWCEGDDPGADSTSTDPGTGDPTDTGDEPTFRVALQGSDDSTDDPGTDDTTNDPGADDTSGDASGPSCTTDDIEVGAVVSSASIDFGPDGGYFSSLELAP